MTAKTHKIETATGVIKTRTASRFVGVRERSHVFVVHVVTAGGSWVEVARRTTEAEARERATVEAARRSVEGRVEVSEHRAVSEVVKRSDSVEVARRAVARAGGGFVFDTETGERV